VKVTRDEISAHIASIARRHAGLWDPAIEARQASGPAPTEQDWAMLVAKFGGSFPAAFVDFMEVMAGYELPGLLQVATDPSGECIAAAYDHEISFGSWDPDLIPFHDDSGGDFYCLSISGGATSAVFHVDHETQKHAPVEASFADWLARIEHYLGYNADEVSCENPEPLDRQAAGRLYGAMAFARQVLKR
jgi:hypothetical protein